MVFKDNLEALPVTQGAKLIVYDETGAEIAAVINGPGTAGSFRVYAYLVGKYGAIDLPAAQEGLEIYAEHVEDARLNPGKHPNIDRLFAVIQTGKVCTVRVE